MKGERVREGIGRLKESRLLWYGVSTFIILGLIYTANFGQFLRALKSIRPVYAGLAFATGLSVFLVWGYVWHSFFRELGIESGLGKSYRMFMAGNFMNSITPLGQLGGEPFMAYVVSKHTDASYEKSLSAVISADLVNAIPFVAYFVAGMIYLVLFGTVTDFLRKTTYLMIGIASALGLIVYLIWFDGKLLEDTIFRSLDLVEARVSRASKYVEAVKDKIRSARSTFEKVGENPSHLLKITLISHIAPLSQFACMYFLLAGSGIDPGVTGVFLTVILGGLAMWSPTPGGSGTVEAALSGLLLVFYPGIALSTAVAVAVLFRLTTYWPGLLIGYVSLLSLRR